MSEERQIINVETEDGKIVEAELLDIRCDDLNDTMTVNMKDGTSFELHVRRTEA